MKNQNLVSSSVPGPWLAPFHILLAPAFIFLAVLLAAPAAFAVTNSTWNVNSGGSWGTAANWTSSQIPASAGDTASLTFNLTAAAIITNDVSRSVGTLNIGDSGSSYFSYILTNDVPGVTLTLDNNGSGASITKSLSTAVDTIYTPLLLNDNLKITNFTTSGSVTFAGALSEINGSRAITYYSATNNTSKITLNLSNNFSGGFTLNGGQVSMLNVYALGTGPITLNANTYYSGGNLLVGTANNATINWTQNLTVLGTSTNTIQLTKNGAKLVLGGQLIGNSSSTLELSSGNLPIFQFSGDFTAFAGTLRLVGNQAGNNAVSQVYDFMNTNLVGAPLAKIVMAPVYKATQNNIAVLEWNPVEATNGIIPIGSLSTVLSNGVQTAANAVLRNARADTTATFQLGGLNTSTTFGGTIQDGAASTMLTALTKVGTGTLTLSGAGNYSGPTIVSNGMLVVNCMLGAGYAATTPVSVVAPGVLGGNGTIGGLLTLSAGNAGILLTNGTAETLTVSGNLTLDSGNKLAFDVGTSADQIAVSGGTYAQTGTATVYVTAIAGFGAGSYNLITGASGITNVNFTLGNTVAGYNMVLTNVDSATLAVVVSAASSATAFWHNRSGTSWNVANNWDTDASGNTALTSVPGIPTDVTFAANAASSYNTTLGADFSIHSLTLSTPNNVTIGGGNTLTLAAGLVNDYGAANNNINTKVVLGVDQVWANNSGNSLIVNSNVSGAHSLTINASGASIVLNAPNTYSGGTIINSGILALGNPTDTLPDSGSVVVNGGTLSLGANSDTVGAVSLTNGSITASSGILTGASYYVESGTVSANLAGAGALTKGNTGTVLLSGANTYSGGTAVAAGTLQLGSATALGSTSGINIIASGATVDLNGQTIAENIGNGNGTVVGTGAGGVGAIVNSSGTQAFVTGALNVGTGVFSIGCNGGDINLSQLTGNNGMNITKVGSGTLTLGGTLDNANNKMTVSEGTLVLAKDPSTIGIHSIGRGPTVISAGATVKLAGSGGDQIANIDVAIDGTFDMNAQSESIGTFAGAASGLITSSAAGAVTLTTANATAGNIKIFAGNIQNGSGTLSFAKTAAYTQDLSGTCTYTGNTAISGGVLLLDGAPAAAAGSTYSVDATNGLQFINASAFTLGALGGSQNFALVDTNGTAIALTVGGNNASTTNSGILSGSGSLIKTGTGTLTLSGNNSYSGGTTVSNGTLTLNSGQTSSTGAITVNDGARLRVTVVGGTQLPPSALTFGTGAVTNSFSGVNSTTVAPVNVSGTLTVNGALKINITSGTFVAGQNYPLIAYGSESISGTVTLGSLPGSVNGFLTDDGISSIYLTVTSVTPEFWTGAANGTWTVGGPANWTTNSVATIYVDGTLVQFDDTATGTTAITNIVSVSPAGITVTNNVKNYSFAGGSIGGSGTLTKTGNGILTLNGTNTYSGGTLVAAGTLEANALGALGSGALTLNGGMLSNSVSATLSNAITLSVNSTVGVKTNSTLTLGQAITSAGSLTVVGGGTLALTGAGNANAGGTMINDGSTLSLQDAAINTYTINAGGTLSLDAGFSLGGATTFTGAGTLRTTNSISFGNPGSHTFAMSAGGLVWVTGGASVKGSSSNRGFWNSNLGSLQVDAGSSINFAEAGNASIVQCDALTGGGVVQGGFYASPQNTVLTVGANNGSGTFTGVLADNTGGADPRLFFNKIGTGTETLTGTNTYTGDTTISAGTLVVNGSLSNSAVTVNGGTLGGTGTIGGPVTVAAAGTLSPGNSIGTLVINNTLSLAGTVRAEVSLDGGVTNCDKVIGLSSVAYGGTLVITNVGGTALHAGVQFPIFSAAAPGTGGLTITVLPATGLIGTLDISSGIVTLSSTALPTPVINQVAYAGGNLILQGTNGAASGTYAILQSTNLALPLSSWTTNTTGTFTGSGAFSNAIPVSTTTHQQFFNIKQP